jgi:zinc and cadmium transporter
MGMALGFSAGAFLCISLSDLLPEVQFHHHDRGKLSASLLLGVALAYGIGLFEGEHAHGQVNHSNHSDLAVPADEDGHNHVGGIHAGHDHAGPHEAGERPASEL